MQMIFTLKAVISLITFWDFYVFSCHLVFSTFVFVASFESQVVGMLLACPIRHVQE